MARLMVTPRLQLFCATGLSLTMSALESSRDRLILGPRPWRLASHIPPEPFGHRPVREVALSRRDEIDLSSRQHSALDRLKTAGLQFFRDQEIR